jgi:hypothetical protein
VQHRSFAGRRESGRAPDGAEEGNVEREQRSGEAGDEGDEVAHGALVSRPFRGAGAYVSQSNRRKEGANPIGGCSPIVMAGLRADRAACVIARRSPSVSRDGVAPDELAADARGGPCITIIEPWNGRLSWSSVS